MKVVEIISSELLNRSSEIDKLKVMVKLDNDMVYEVHFIKIKGYLDPLVVQFLPSFNEICKRTVPSKIVQTMKKYSIPFPSHESLGKEILNHPKVRLKKLQLS